VIASPLCSAAGPGWRRAARRTPQDAAHGLVHALAPTFRARTGYDIEGEFGAVGTMGEKLRSGKPADILILTSNLIGTLTQEGHVADGTRADRNGRDGDRRALRRRAARSCNGTSRLLGYHLPILIMIRVPVARVAQSFA
jgi:hypothetical protein